MDSLTEHFNRQANSLKYLFWWFTILDFSENQEKRRRRRNLKLSRKTCTTTLQPTDPALLKFRNTARNG